MGVRISLPTKFAMTSVAGAAILASCAPVNETTQSASAAPAQTSAMPAPSGMPHGYLATTDLPDSLALLPPPPEAGSAAFARDEEVSRAMTRSPDSPRFQQAASDADLNPAHALTTFACAVGRVPDQKSTPVLYQMLFKTMVDVGLSTYKAKTHYQRVRPFVAHNNSTCFPHDEAALRKDGSYPSGHSAVGWGWALVLTELAPGQANQILQRGRDFGQSRLVCNAHWASDVEAGRVIASATVARLHADASFEADLLAAKKELFNAALPDPAKCTAEAAALTQ